MHSAFARQQILPERPKRKSDDGVNLRRSSRTKDNSSFVAPHPSMRSGKRMKNSNDDVRPSASAPSKGVLVDSTDTNQNRQKQVPQQKPHCVVPFSTSYRRELALQPAPPPPPPPPFGNTMTRLPSSQQQQQRRKHFLGGGTITVQQHNERSNAATDEDMNQMSQLTFSQSDLFHMSESTQTTFPHPSGNVSAGKCQSSLPVSSHPHHHNSNNISNRNDSKFSSGSSVMSTASIPLGQKSFSITTSDDASLASHKNHHGTSLNGTSFDRTSLSARLKALAGATAQHYALPNPMATPRHNNHPLLNPQSVSSRFKIPFHPSTAPPRPSTMAAATTMTPMTRCGALLTPVPASFQTPRSSYQQQTQQQSDQQKIRPVRDHVQEEKHILTQNHQGQEQQLHQELTATGDQRVEISAIANMQQATQASNLSNGLSLPSSEPGHSSISDLSLPLTANTAETTKQHQLGTEQFISASKAIDSAAPNSNGSLHSSSGSNGPPALSITGTKDEDNKVMHGKLEEKITKATADLQHFVSDRQDDFKKQVETEKKGIIEDFEKEKEKKLAEILAKGQDMLAKGRDIDDHLKETKDNISRDILAKGQDIDDHLKETKEKIVREIEFIFAEKERSLSEKAESLHRQVDEATCTVSDHVSRAVDVTEGLLGKIQAASEKGISAITKVRDEFLAMGKMGLVRTAIPFLAEPVQNMVLNFLGQSSTLAIQADNMPSAPEIVEPDSNFAEVDSGFMSNSFRTNSTLTNTNATKPGTDEEPGPSKIKTVTKRGRPRKGSSREYVALNSNMRVDSASEKTKSSIREPPAPQTKTRKIEKVSALQKAISVQKCDGTLQITRTKSNQVSPVEHTKVEPSTKKKSKVQERSSRKEGMNSVAHFISNNDSSFWSPTVERSFVSPANKENAIFFPNGGRVSLDEKCITSPLCCKKPKEAPKRPMRRCRRRLGASTTRQSPYVFDELSFS